MASRVLDVAAEPLQMLNPIIGPSLPSGPSVSFTLVQGSQVCR